MYGRKTPNYWIFNFFPPVHRGDGRHFRLDDSEVLIMEEHKRFFILIFIMAAVAFIIATVTITLLYNTSLQVQQGRLVETAQSRARIIEAIARFDAEYSSDYPEGSEAATISQIVDAHEHFEGFGETGEFTLARRTGDDIVFLLSHRNPYHDTEHPTPTSWDTDLAEPMRRALSGESGTLVGPDYRGVEVLAAYEPVDVLDLGIVAKIDMSEVRAPFLRAGFIALGSAFFLVLFGAFLFLRISNPMIKQMELSEARMREMNVELLNKNKELEQIVYVTSHDLRSPLVNIQGFSNELKQSFDEISSTLQDKEFSPDKNDKVFSVLHNDVPEALQYIQSSVGKMDSLLAGLLQLSRIGRTGFKIEKLDMNKLLSDTLEVFEFQIKEKNINLAVDELPSCMGDTSQINQAFSNLIDNALKNIDPSRPGIIHISGLRENGTSVYCVEDNGVGITSENLEKIFGLFYQANPEAESGDGVGLSIVQRIVTRLRGRTWAESKIGVGSKFFVALPAS